MHLAYFKRATRDFLRLLMSLRLFEAFLCSPAVPGFFSDENQRKIFDE